jgi:hypothetical protein
MISYSTVAVVLHSMIARMQICRCTMHQLLESEAGEPPGGFYAKGTNDTSLERDLRPGEAVRTNEAPH